MSRVRFKMYTMSPPFFATQPEVQIAAFSEQFLATAETPRWWEDRLGGKFSIVKAQVLDEYALYGFITQQHEMDVHTYDENKTESSDIVDSFADRMFVVDKRINIVALEWRQFRKQRPLNLSATVERLQRVLSDIAEEAGLEGGILLSEYSETTSKQEFIRMFYEYKILRIVVDEFGSENVPSEVTLVNPTPGMEDVTRKLITHDRAKSSMSRFIAEAHKRGAGLGPSAFARAALHSGQPKELTFVSGTGETKTRRQIQDSSIEVDISGLENGPSSDGHDAANAVLGELQTTDIVQTVPGASGRQRTLFEGKSEKQQ